MMRSAMSSGHGKAWDTARWWASPCRPSQSATVSLGTSVLVACPRRRSHRRGRRAAASSPSRARPDRRGSGNCRRESAARDRRTWCGSARDGAGRNRGRRCRRRRGGREDRRRPRPRRHADPSPARRTPLHDGQHDGRLVGEVRVDRRGGDADPAGDRPQRDRAFVAGLVEQFDRGGDDVLAQAPALAAAVAGPGRFPRGRRACACAFGRRVGVARPVGSVGSVGVAVSSAVVFFTLSPYTAKFIAGFSCGSNLTLVVLRP